MRSRIILIALLSGCGGTELEVELGGLWNNDDGNSLFIQTTRGEEGRVLAELDGRYRVGVREHPFGGFSLGFEDGQTIVPPRGTSFMSTGFSVFCRACMLELADDERPESRLDCKTKTISIEQFGVKLSEAEFGCEWTRRRGDE